MSDSPISGFVEVKQVHILPRSIFDISLSYLPKALVVPFPLIN